MRSTPPEPLEFGVATAMDPVSTTGWTHTRLDFALDAPLPFQNLGREGGDLQSPMVRQGGVAATACGTSGRSTSALWEPLVGLVLPGDRPQLPPGQHSAAGRLWRQTTRRRAPAQRGLGAGGAGAMNGGSTRARRASRCPKRPAASIARACFEVRADVEQVSRKKIEKFGPIRCPTRRSRSGCLWHKWFGTSSV